MAVFYHYYFLLDLDSFESYIKWGTSFLKRGAQNKRGGTYPSPSFIDIFRRITLLV